MHLGRTPLTSNWNLDMLIQRKGVLMPRGGLEAQSFGNSLTLNKIALPIEYNRLADFATKSINSTASFRLIKFVTLWAPRRLTWICPGGHQLLALATGNFCK